MGTHDPEDATTGTHDPDEAVRSYDAGQESLGEVSVLLVDDDEAWLRTMQEVLEAGNGTFSVTTATDLDDARTTFDGLDPDCVVCDYRLGEGDGLDLLVHVRDRDPDRPFVLVTGEGSETVATGAIRQRVTDYIRKRSMADRPDLLVGRVKAAVRTYRAERALARERRSKEAMLEIVTATSSTEGLARDFCRHLVAERGYACAWIGAYDPSRGLVPRAIAGTEGYLDDAVEPNVGPGEGTEPALVALDRREPYVVAPIPGDEGDGSDWRSVARDKGFEAAAAVPIAHESTLVGVLAVYDADADVVDDDERDLLAEYGETIGYALRTAKWKESLLSPSPVTVDFEVTDDGAPLVAFAAALPDCSAVEVSSAIPTDGGLLYLATVHGASTGAIREAARAVAQVDDVDVAPDGRRCELSVPAPTPESVLVDRGARLVGTVVDRGVATVSVVVHEEQDIQALGDALEATFPESSVSAFGTDRDRDRPRGVVNVLMELTDKQRRALELAFHGGYYQRPREHNATELAAKLGVSRSTFTQHLTAAERKVFARLLEGE